MMWPSIVMDQDTEILDILNVKLSTIEPRGNTWEINEQSTKEFLYKVQISIPWSVSQINIKQNTSLWDQKRRLL